METKYRRATIKDLPEVWEVFATTIDKLDKDHGFFEKPTPASPPNPQLAFWLKKDPGAFIVAETEDGIAGYSFSYLRGRLWYLADLFVLPGHQGKGIGKALIERTLGSWKGHTIDNRAVITPAFNPVSASLYMQFEMLPRQPVYFASAPRIAVARSLGKERDGQMQVDELAGSEAVRAADRMHQQVLGIPAGWQNEFFVKEQEARCLLFKKGGIPEGYGFIREDGRIGPLLVASESSFQSALEATLRASAELDCEQITIFFPGTNPGAARTCAERGFRIGYPLLFMSSRSMGEWRNYLFYSPALM